MWHRAVMRTLALLCVAATVLSGTSAFAAERASTAPVALVNPLSAGAVVQTILGLMVVVAVIVAVAWLLRRVSQMQAGVQGALKVVAGLSLGARERVVLMQVGEKQLLLGVAPGRIQTLYVLEQPLPAAAGGMSAELDFAERLKHVLAQVTGKYQTGTGKPGQPS